MTLRHEVQIAFAHVRAWWARRVRKVRVRGCFPFHWAAIPDHQAEAHFRRRPELMRAEDFIERIGTHRHIYPPMYEITVRVLQRLEAENEGKVVFVVIR